MIRLSCHGNTDIYNQVMVVVTVVHINQWKQYAISHSGSCIINRGGVLSGLLKDNVNFLRFVITQGFISS